MFEEASLPVRTEQSFIEGGTYFRFVLGVGRGILPHEFIFAVRELTLVAVPAVTDLDPILAHLCLVLGLVHSLTTIRLFAAIRPGLSTCLHILPLFRLRFLFAQAWHKHLWLHHQMSCRHLLLSVTGLKLSLVGEVLIHDSGGNLECLRIYFRRVWEIELSSLLLRLWDLSPFEVTRLLFRLVVGVGNVTQRLTPSVGGVSLSLGVIGLGSTAVHLNNDNLRF